ncbi:MAG: hypothetical protein IKU24_00365, partial [Clostridia bacterium]|nr:hypothetical protein [Clostridia bacterium]
ETYKGQLVAGSRKVFETSSFTVTVDDTKNKNATVNEDGTLNSYLADVDTDEAYTGDTEAVVESTMIAFEESMFRSAPYFDLQIDGITLLNAKF